MGYASVEDVEAGYGDLTEKQISICEALLEEAGEIIDSCNGKASEKIKKIVSCRMVRRAIGSLDVSGNAFPMGATQGTVSALGYSQTWAMGNGSAGELYLSRAEKKLLGSGNRIGTHSPLEDMQNA